MVKLAVVAVLATMLVRFPWFRRILLTEKRDWPERLVFAASLGVPLTAGVVARLLLNYDAADLTLSGSFLAGLLAGPYAGAIVGSMVGMPAAPRRRMDRAALRDRLRLCRRRPARDLPEGSDLALLAALLHRPAPLRLAAGAAVPDRLGRHPARGADRPRDPPPGARPPLRPSRALLPPRADERRGCWRCVILATVLCVAIPIKIWNSARIEHRLQEQEKLLMAARVEALASQINPHFLFNTLTSISSLIRSQPETARMLIVKLSGLLRRLLRSQEHFVTLREELEAIDEYLDIESIRFGPKLTIEKSHRPGSLDVVVPEHAAAAAGRELDQARPVAEDRRRPHHHPQHARRTATRSSTSSTTASASPPTHAERVKGSGIGLRNVNERLRVIYGANYQLQLDSVPGEGTCARIVIPELVVPARITGLTWTPPSTLRTVVVDDEQLAREELCFLLGQIRRRRGRRPGGERRRGAAR